MAYEAITVEEIMETLSKEEQDEMKRDDFMIPLKRCIAGYNKGEYAQHRANLVGDFRLYAKNRTAVRNEIDRNPDVAKVPVEVNGPVFIIGMPRSGTTFLQRLLSCDDYFLSPMYWEMVSSVPPGRPNNWRECKRFKDLIEQEQFKTVQNGLFDNVHMLRLDLEEECLMILQQYFLTCGQPVCLDGLSEWADFVYNCPRQHVMNAYEYHKKCLKCIFYGNLDESKSLLLKTPVHLLYLDVMREVYPNAKFIYPYRSLESIIGSFASLEHKISLWFDPDADKHGVGQRVLEYIRQSASKLVEVLKKWPKDCYINIDYTDVVQDPMATVKRIYSHFDLQLTPGAKEAMQRYLQENPQNKHGKHEYSLDQFGITNEDIKDNFEEYLDYFKNGKTKIF